MDTKISTEVSPDEIPEGFTAAPLDGSAGPAAAAGGAGARAAGAGAAGAGNAEQAAQAEALRRQSILEQAMDTDALARLRRIKLVKPEKATHVEKMIASMAVQGRLPGRITEGKLIEMLEGLNAASSGGIGSGGAAGAGGGGGGGGGSGISIQRKKYAFDSDDSDDNDDDLL
mmetsp:Transcript_12825/g.27718  ORF Transcript_12825/g.27718 Transcript_12825/m.27718 type:complete len:172 (-) Transcript_12825:244-759(-)